MCFFFNRQNEWRKAQPDGPVHNVGNAGDPTITSLKAWLKNCDDHHQNCHNVAYTDSTAQQLPSRLLNVSPSNDPNQIRLDEKASGAYIALSHCWGETTDAEKPKWCTVSDNYHKRLNGFSLEDLGSPEPKTLKDAIEITRELGIQYLWIDSLCIIQAGDKGEDWEKESKKNGVCLCFGVLHYSRIFRW